MPRTHPMTPPVMAPITPETSGSIQNHFNFVYMLFRPRNINHSTAPSTANPESGCGAFHKIVRSCQVEYKVEENGSDKATQTLPPIISSIVF